MSTPALPLNPLAQLLVLLLLASGCATLAPPLPPPAPLAEDEAATVAAVRMWQFGDSRAPLVEVERMCVASLRDEAYRRSMARALTDLLADEAATYEARQFASRQLVLIAQAENVAEIAPLLTAPEYSDMARYALEPMDSPLVDEALVAALPLTTGATKIGIINSLGYRRTQDARDHLEALARSDDAAIAQAAANALAKINE